MYNFRRFWIATPPAVARNDDRFYSYSLVLFLLVSSLGAVQAANPNQPLIHNISAVAQIRFPEKKTATIIPVNPPTPTVNPPVEVPVSSTPIPVIVNNPAPSNPSPAPVIDQFDLILNLIPNSKLGIFYDRSKPITINNPVRIYNTRSGGYSSVYFDKDGFLQISVGVVPNEFNDVKPLGPNSTVDPKNLNFTDSATLSTYYSESEIDLSSAKSVNSNSLSMDVLPRVNKRYGVVTKTFISASGIVVPQGSVVVGTRKDGLENIHRPEFNEFENIRFYSPDGVLINIAGNQSKQDIDCGLGKAAACMDFNRFYTPVGTKEFGAKVAATYNPKDFFSGKSAQDANNIWLKIQKDLEANTVLDINSANEDWLSRIFKDLNEQEEVYIGNLLNNLNRTEFLRKLFAYDPNSMQKDSTAKVLYDKQFNTLYDFVKAKQAVWELEDKVNNSSGKDKVDAQQKLPIALNDKSKVKALFESARDEYIQYLKKGESTANKSTSTSTSSTSTQTTSPKTTSTPAPAPKEEPKPKNNKKKK